MARLLSSPAARALGKARDAAEQGDALGVADALMELDDGPRFVATLALEVIHPELPPEATFRLDGEVALDASQWPELCSSALVRAWAALARGRVPVPIVRRIVGERPPARAEKPAALLPLDALRWERRFDRRARAATAHVAARARECDRAAAFEALMVAIEGHPSHAVEAHERSGWAAALAESGDVGRACEALIETARVSQLDERAWAIAGRAFLHPRARKLARRFVEEALDRKLELRTIGDRWERRPVSDVLAHVAAATNDDDLLRRLLEGVAIDRPTDDGPHPANVAARRDRIAGALAALDDALGGDLPPWFAAWSRALEDIDRPLLAAAARAMSARSLSEIDACAGTVEERDAPALARALARRGRMDDALALAARFEPERRQRMLMAIRGPDLDARTRRALYAGLERCPRASRRRDDQVAYRHRLAVLALDLGRVDHAIDVLSKLGDTAHPRHGVAHLALELLRFLDDRRELATPDRLARVAAAASSTRASEPHLAEVGMEIAYRIVTLASERGRRTFLEGAAVRMRNRLATGDRAMVMAGLAAGAARAGERDEAAEMFRACLTAAAKGERRFFRARRIVRAASWADLASWAPGLYTKLFATFELHHDGERACERDIRRVIFAAPLAERAHIREMVADHALKHEWIAPARDALAEAAASAGDVGELEALLDGETRARAVRARVRQIARALAVAGKKRDALAVGALVGLR